MKRAPIPTRRLARLLLVLCVTTQMSAPPAARGSESNNVNFQAGDVLLVPLNCYVCNAIENETGVPYSHSVVVATTTNSMQEASVYEAWGSVKRTPLLEILQRAEKNQPLLHMRPREFSPQFTPTEQQFSNTFSQDFEDLPFDNLFLWDNKDENGKELLYCSEFVVKFINRFLADPEPPLPMSFLALSDFWNTYYRQFNETPPEGLPGVSPATIANSPRFRVIGQIPSDPSP